MTHQPGGLSAHRMDYLLRHSDARTSVANPAPVIDWKGHRPLRPLNWYLGLAVDVLGPAGYFDGNYPDSCEPDCPPCAVMQAELDDREAAK